MSHGTYTIKVSIVETDSFGHVIHGSEQQIVLMDNTTPQFQYVADLADLAVAYIEDFWPDFISESEPRNEEIRSKQEEEAGQEKP